MLRECIEICPGDLWGAPNPAVAPTEGTRVLYSAIAERPFWRIAFHNAFFTHLYLGQNESSFQVPPPSLGVRTRKDFELMWEPPWSVEPYDLPTGAEPISKSDLVAYVAYIGGLVDSTVDALDLDSSDSGFPWYKSTTKLSHELMNIRHFKVHVGQLSELLMMRGIDIHCVG